MPTPDPIALPELPEPAFVTEGDDLFTKAQTLAYGQARYEAGRAAQAKHQQQQVGHLPKDAIAWLDMGKGEAQLMFGKRDASNRANKRQLTMLFEKVNPGYHPLYLHPQEEVATPPNRSRKMDAKHTPGPWVAAEEESPQDEGWVIKSDSRPYVASVLWGANLGETQANAKLMAAAPDLLAAIEAMMDAYDNESSCRYPEHRMARAAIAKATGDAQ